MSIDPPKRRWCRFSLRTLLIVTTVATVAIGGWVRYRKQQQRAQENRDRVTAVEKAVVEIEKLGGTVTSEYEKLRSQTWLEEHFNDPGGADNPVGVLNVSHVGLLSADVIDSDLKPLKELKNLQELSLICKNITDAGLEHLKGLESLQTLSLYRCKVTDAGLEHLEGLSNLRFLGLEYTNVTGRGVWKLRKALPNCHIYYHPCR